MIQEDGLCRCGCGQATSIAKQSNSRRGHIKGLPMEYRQGHGNRQFAAEFVEEDHGYTTPCRMWQGSTTGSGHGQRREKGTGKLRVVHVLAWEAAYGPVLPGFDLSHLCRMRVCANVEHLEPATHEVNAQRGANAKLTPDAVRTILGSSGQDSELATRFGVQEDTIYRVRSRHTWKNIQIDGAGI